MEKVKQENILDKLGISFHRKLSFKLLIIGMLVILLLIPKVMILSLISERSISSNTAITEVMSKWSNEQTISGPVLYIPFKKMHYNQTENKYQEQIQTAVFLPDQLNIKGKIIPKKLNRSIYKVHVYESELLIEGSFDSLDLESINIEASEIMWNDAQLQLCLSDLRGISTEMELNWNDKNFTFSPGIKSSAVGNTGISISAKDLGGEIRNGKFQIDLHLKGSKQIMFTPLGEKTTVRLHSSWNDPGFDGNFLPTQRVVNENGFEANWTVFHFNRNYPQQWVEDVHTVSKSDIANSSFGVKLVNTANQYQKNTRSAKYAILIILITFIVFFMYEVFSKQRIHPFQYVLVGSAITIFYLLLLSFSEHIGFNLAYLTASVAVILLVFIYSRSFMPKMKNSLGTTLSLAGCYGFIFVLLQLESYALLAGSIGLFLLLAILMYSTRKINWYNK